MNRQGTKWRRLCSIQGARGKGKVGCIPFENRQDKVLRVDQHGWKSPFSLCLHIVSFTLPGSSFNPTLCNFRV
ncbi:MAG: hypothetical protein QW172_03970, partial [Candidatus Bathyarchaeia archaeon]